MVTVVTGKVERSRFILGPFVRFHIQHIPYSWRILPVRSVQPSPPCESVPLLIRSYAARCAGSLKIRQASAAEASADTPKS